MKPQIKILSGLSAGAQYVYSQNYIAVGRHPASDLRFDAEKELDVSARHAAIVKQGGKWLVRDLGSKNGTLVNGHRTTGDLSLDDTDQIQFGAQGPKVEFRLVPDSTPDSAAPSRAGGEIQATLASGAARGGQPAPAAAGSSHPSTSQRIRIEVQRQTKGLRAITGVLFGVLLIAAGAFVFENRRQEQLREREARAMQARIDSVLATSQAAVQSLKGQVAGLADALHGSQSEVERLNRDLTSARASGNTQAVESLRARLDGAAETLRNQQIAAQVDYSAIRDANQNAVAIIYVEFAPGEVYTGTAFAVTHDGVMITNRHVVAGPEGTKRPSRIGVKFADSNQNFAARLLAISPDKDIDVAILKVDIHGGNPTVKPLDPPAEARPGDPVAVIGFPLGVELPTDRRGGQDVARTTITAGMVSKVLPTLLQVDGYGAEGSSGSPIFNREGRVVGVLYGGQPGTGGRIVFAVPVSYAVQLARPYIGNPSQN